MKSATIAHHQASSSSNHKNNSNSSSSNNDDDDKNSSISNNRIIKNDFRKKKFITINIPFLLMENRIVENLFKRNGNAPQERNPSSESSNHSGGGSVRARPVIAIDGNDDSNGVRPPSLASWKYAYRMDSLGVKYAYDEDVGAGSSASESEEDQHDNSGPDEEGNLGNDFVGIRQSKKKRRVRRHGFARKTTYIADQRTPNPPVLDLVVSKLVSHRALMARKESLVLVLELSLMKVGCFHSSHSFAKKGF